MSARYSVVDVPRPPPPMAHRGDRRDCHRRHGGGSKVAFRLWREHQPHHLLDFIHAGRPLRTVERQSTHQQPMASCDFSGCEQLRTHCGIRSAVSHFTCYFVLCFGFSRFLSAIHLPGDYSYGVYIYGWPAQQLMAMWFPHWSAPQNAASALVFAMVWPRCRGI